MQHLKFALVQSTLHWEDKEKNRTMFDNILKRVEPDTDVVVLPEMFTTGFSMETEKLAEPTEGPTLKWLRQKAGALEACITGSFIVEENGRKYNRLIWMFPDGTFSHYDKRHLFVMAGEDKHFTRGKQKVIVSWKGWKICPLICFDLRFPAFVRNQEYYDCMVCVANWPEKRSHHWRTLIPARAIENQCYVIAVNRVGKDGNKVNHRGDSCVIDPGGETLLSSAYAENLMHICIERDAIEKTRRHMPFLEDQDEFEIR